MIAGYSFGDEHINEILFEALRNNSRLSVTALMFDALSTGGTMARLVEIAGGLRNLSVYGPDQACIAGVVGQWTAPGKAPLSPLTKWPFWDEKTNLFTLGDFVSFADFLRLFFALRDAPPPVSAPGVSPATP